MTCSARHPILSSLPSCAPQKLNISPAYLRNDNNKYLNYTDDWYILASKPDEYVVIYYRGNNDAWKGYGGATVYTRCVAWQSLQGPVLPIGVLGPPSARAVSFTFGLIPISSQIRAFGTAQGVGALAVIPKLGFRRWA